MKGFTLSHCAIVLSLAGAAGNSLGAPLVDPWADQVVNYSPGALQESPIGSGAYFTDPAAALGAVSPAASVLVPSNDVVQLGQGGSLTLAFHEPIHNNRPAPGTDNPLGIDFVVFGNAFEAGMLGSGLFFREPGYVEVAQRGANGEPVEWYLLLAEPAPADLASADSGPGPLYGGYADVNPVNGSGNPLLPPGPDGSAGGDGFLLERAVLQSSPGVPLLGDAGLPRFLSLDEISFIRITDALPADAGITGYYTTDIDAVVDLPGLVPEPSALVLLACTSILTLRRRIGPNTR